MEYTRHKTAYIQEITKWYIQGIEVAYIHDITKGYIQGIKTAYILNSNREIARHRKK